MKNRKKNFLREVTKPLAAPTHGGGVGVYFSQNFTQNMQFWRFTYCNMS